MLRIQTAEYMISDTHGLGVARSWLPRVVDEQFLESTKDGEIKLSPDPVTTITGSLTWYNNTGDPQDILVQVLRAPRNIIAQNPSTVIITDAWTHQKGPRPQADYPSVVQDTFGGRLQIDRPSAAADDVQYGRYFLFGDGSQAYVPIGTVLPEESFHFRYIAAIQTPGVWIDPTGDFTPRWEAYAYWTRLIALASPTGVEGV